MDALTESHKKEAAHAAAVAEEAKQKALLATVREVFREEMSPEKGRYMDMSRLPLICQTIVRTGEDIDELKTSLRELKQMMEDKYVSKEAFTPVQRLVYGLVGIILTLVCTAIIGMVLIK